MIPHWKTLSKKVVAENRFLKLEDHLRAEETTGKQGDFFIVNARNWVNIIALTERNEIVMIEQFRHGSEQIELELPSGIIDEGEEPADAALRELLEETGYQPSDGSVFKKIGEVLPNPAFMTNTSYTYLLTHARLTGTTDYDEFENIRVRLIPENGCEELILSGEIRHSLIIAAFYWLRLAESSVRS